MKIDCPHGYKMVAKLGNVTWEDHTVSIYGGVCDTADRCKITHCKFYDLSPAGQAKFVAALKEDETLEGLIARETAH